MDQNPGHQAVTKDAVHALFSKEIGLADSHGLIRGITENEYYDKLNLGQKFQDRLWDAGTNLPGPTTHPWWANPGAQKDHFLALPSKTGLDNLSADRERIVELMVAAMKPELGHSELMTLGAAMHGLQDSYSSAHVWRALSVYFGDYKAPVQSINLFDPLGIVPKSPGVPWTEGTHDPKFDRVSVDQQGHVISGSAVAAARGTLDALIHYERALKDHLDGGHASIYFQKELETLCPAAPSGVDVNMNYGSHDWRNERDHRIHLEESSIGKVHLAPADVADTVPHSPGAENMREHGHDGKADVYQVQRDQRAGHGHAGDAQASDKASMVSPEPRANSTDVPFNVHIPVPQLLPPNLESHQPQLQPTAPTGPAHLPVGPFDFQLTQGDPHGGLHLDVPPVHLGSYIDLTPFPHPDPPSGEPNPGNAERATDHSRRDPEDAASDSLAQAQIGTGIWAIGTFALGLHPDHGQKGDAEAAPHGAYPSPPPDPHPPQGRPTDPSAIDHAAPPGLHLSVPQLHIDQPGGQAEALSAVGHDPASSFNLHLLPPGAELHQPGATAAADPPDHGGPDVHLDPTFGHGSGTPFNLQLDPSAGQHGQSVHGFDLQLQPPGADGTDGSPGANPFNLHLDVSSLANQPGAQGTSEHPGAAHDTVPGMQGAPHDSQAPPLDQAHLGDAAHVADVGQGGSG